MTTSGRAIDPRDERQMIDAGTKRRVEP